jgi:hypothetical protein
MSFLFIFILLSYLFWFYISFLFRFFFVFSILLHFFLSYFCFCLFFAVVMSPSHFQCLHSIQFINSAVKQLSVLLRIRENPFHISSRHVLHSLSLLLLSPPSKCQLKQATTFPLQFIIISLKTKLV